MTDDNKTKDQPSGGQPFGGMTLGRFATILEAYGADHARWPDAERDAAIAFAATSEQAGALIAEARALDLALDIAPEAQVSDALVARILATAPQPQSQALGAGSTAPQARGLVDRIGDTLAALWPQQSVLRPAGLLAASLSLGFFVGMNNVTATAATETGDEDLISYVFGAPVDEEWLTTDWSMGEQE